MEFARRDVRFRVDQVSLGNFSSATDCCNSVPLSFLLALTILSLTECGGGNRERSDLQICVCESGFWITSERTQDENLIDARH